MLILSKDLLEVQQFQSENSINKGMSYDKSQQKTGNPIYEVITISK